MRSPSTAPSLSGKIGDGRADTARSLRVSGVVSTSNAYSEQTSELVIAPVKAHRKSANAQVVIKAVG